MDSNYVKIEQKEEEEAVTKEEQEQEQKETEEQPILERDEEEEEQEEEAVVQEKEVPPIAESTPKKPTTVIIDTKDGVFANMAAKPEIPPHSEGSSSQQQQQQHQEELPTYADVADDRAPDYGLSSVVFLPNDDTPLVDGIPMGTFLHFVFGAIVSYTFQLVGFILAYVFAVSHAGRFGARVGLGINMVQYGTYLSRSVDDQGYLRNSGSQNGGDDSSSSFLSYFLMLMGWIIIIQALVDYYRVYKYVKGVQVQRSSNENNV